MLGSVTYYVGLHVGAKQPVFHLSPRDGHVIFVSGCLILTAVNSSSCGLLNITDRLVSIYARSIVIHDIGLHVVVVRAARRTQRHQIFLRPQVSNFSYQWDPSARYKSIKNLFTSAEREVKDSRRSGMYQSCNFLTRLGKQSLQVFGSIRLFDEVRAELVRDISRSLRFL